MTINNDQNNNSGRDNEAISEKLREQLNVLIERENPMAEAAQRALELYN